MQGKRMVQNVTFLSQHFDSPMAFHFTSDVTVKKDQLQVLQNEQTQTFSTIRQDRIEGFNMHSNANNANPIL